MRQNRHEGTRIDLATQQRANCLEEGSQNPGCRRDAEDMNSCRHTQDLGAPAREQNSIVHGEALHNALRPSQKVVETRSHHTAPGGCRALPKANHGGHSHSAAAGCRHEKTRMDAEGRTVAVRETRQQRTTRRDGAQGSDVPREAREP